MSQSCSKNDMIVLLGNDRATAPAIAQAIADASVQSSVIRPYAASLGAEESRTRLLAPLTIAAKGVLFACRGDRHHWRIAPNLFQ